ncbi:hypothetical protein N9F08_00770 [bacterium]|nr:hypothetical protein [bacterium]
MVIDLQKISITETKAFKLYQMEGNVLFFDYKNNITIELEDVKEAFDLYIEHSENFTCKVLISMGEYSTIEVDARNYVENKKMPTPAQAVIIRNLAQRMIARFYQLLRKDSHPLKFFGNTENALSWLETI